MRCVPDDLEEQVINLEKDRYEQPPKRFCAECEGLRAVIAFHRERIDYLVRLLRDCDKALIECQDEAPYCEMYERNLRKRVQYELGDSHAG